MFNGLFGKGNNRDKKSPEDALDTRGLEVVEVDQDTAWGLWDSVLAEQDSRFLDEAPAGAEAALPPPSMLSAPPTAERPKQKVDAYAPTEPMGLQEKSIEQRTAEALEIVQLHHARVANSIRTMWGHKECVQYINKLVMGGSDNTGHARMGFHQEAVQAMLELANLHEAQFGPVDEGPITGFSSLNFR
jgi:hypothetical protein